MAKDSEDRRFVWGPRPLGTLIPHLTKPVFRKKSPAGALLMADWPEVVGPALAAVTSPKRVTGGTLTIGCVGPVAMELTHLAPQLIARINAQLGKPLVERLRFVQQAAGTTAPPRPHPQPAAALPPAVEAAVATLPSGELRDALAKLAQGVYRNRE
jgi:hypothetical protein